MLEANLAEFISMSRRMRGGGGGVTKKAII
jgi:hypothetical protein